MPGGHRRARNPIVDDVAEIVVRRNSFELSGAEVQAGDRVTLEIEAEMPEGAPGNVVRTVTENSRTLKFTSNSGFETE